MHDARPTHIRTRACMGQVLFLLAVTLAWPWSPSADQAQYFYDALGRLNAVIDGTGAAAYYQYDAVGNVLSIEREANPGPPTITSLTPNMVTVGTTEHLTIEGTQLRGAVVTIANPNIQILPLAGATETTVEVELAVPPGTTAGATLLTVTTPIGDASDTLTVLDVVTMVTGTVVDETGTPVNGARVDLFGGPSGVTAADGSFQFANISTIQFPTIHVSASITVNGEDLVGASAIIPAVANGLTDVGVIMVTAAQLDHEFGQPLPFGELQAEFVSFPQGFTFPFYGTTYAGVFVTPSGRLTFESLDASGFNTIERINEQPGLFVGVGSGDNQVFLKQWSDRFMVTWLPSSTSNHRLVQVTLYQGGRITLAFGESSSFGKVGITPSHSLSDVDFAVDAPFSTTSPVAIYETRSTGDLSQQLLTFTPNPQNGFDVELSALPAALTTVVGTVVDEQGAPLDGANVSILGGPKTVTAGDGTFVFADVSIYDPQVLRVLASATIAGEPRVAISLPTRALANAMTDVGTLTVAPYFFEPDFGERVSLDDNDEQFLNFEDFGFPFYPTVYAFDFGGLRVESNGRLNLWSRDIVIDETLAEFTERPQIAPFFDNLNPSGIGEVYAHQFPNRFVVTWSQVPEFAAVGANTIQATLFRDGRILFAYAGMTADDAIVGISPGSSPPFSETDFSTELPLGTTEPVPIYEEFDGPLPADGETVGIDPFDLDQTMILFVPNANGGYDVRQVPFVAPTTTVVGTVVDATGAPVSGIQVATKTGETTTTAADGTFTFASLATTTGAIQVSATDFSGALPLYGVSLPATPVPMGLTDVGTVMVAGSRVITELGEPLHQDDNDFDLVPFTHGFSFPFFGMNYTQLYANSNGRITFQFGDTASSETVVEFDEQPQIAVFFDDWRPEDRFAHDAAEEAIYVNQFPNFVVVTWPRVTEAALFDTGANTLQATLFSDGRITLAYQDITSDDGIIGISPGNSATLIESNLSADAPFSTSSPIAIYEEFKGPLPDDFGETLGTDPFDLDGKFLTFIPNVNGGYDVDVTPPSIESGTTTVGGTVVDGMGTPVGGVAVQVVNGPTGTTASDGTFTLTAVPFTSQTSVQVSATMTQNGQAVTGLSPLVPPVPSGITDVGPIILGRQYRALGASRIPPQAALVDIAGQSVTFDPIATGRPQDVAATTDGQIGLVINSRGSTAPQVAWYDLAADPPVLLGSLETPTLENPSAAVITPDNRFAVLSGGQGNESLVVVDLAQRSVASDVGTLPGNQAAAVTPDGSQILVLSYSFPRELSVVSLDANGVATDNGQRVAIPGFDRGQIHITPNGKRALINDPGRNAVDILAIDNGVVTYLDTIKDIGTGDFGVTDLAITPDGTKVYVSNYFDSALYVLAIDDNDVVTKTNTKIVVPAGLFGVDFPPSNGMDFTFDGRTLVLVGTDRDVVSFVDTVTDTVLPEVIRYQDATFVPGIATYEVPF